MVLFHAWLFPCRLFPWWRHQIETFSALLALCAGNLMVTGEFPAQRPVTWSFDVFFDRRLNKRFSKQWWGWWLETPSCSLWRHFYALSNWHNGRSDPRHVGHYIFQAFCGDFGLVIHRMTCQEVQDIHVWKSDSITVCWGSSFLLTACYNWAVTTFISIFSN